MSLLSTSLRHLMALFVTTLVNGICRCCRLFGFR